MTRGWWQQEVQHTAVGSRRSSHNASRVRFSLLSAHSLSTCRVVACTVTGMQSCHALGWVCPRATQAWCGVRSGRQTIHRCAGEAVVLVTLCLPMQWPPAQTLRASCSCWHGCSMQQLAGHALPLPACGHTHTHADTCMPHCSYRSMGTTSPTTCTCGARSAGC